MTRYNNTFRYHALKHTKPLLIQFQVKCTLICLGTFIQMFAVYHIYFFIAFNHSLCRCFFLVWNASRFVKSWLFKLLIHL